ncbi:MAG: YcfL family protein [Planctomycetota bacterium]
MVKYSLIIMCIGALVLGGCASKPSDERVTMAHGVGGDTPGDSIITRPFGMVISALLGEGIEITEKPIEARTPEGFLDVQMKGYNKAYGIKRFDYRVEWLDANGMVIPTKTSVWVPVSAMGKSEVTFRFIAPRKEAVDFRINTRKNKITK